MKLISQITLMQMFAPCIARAWHHDSQPLHGLTQRSLRRLNAFDEKDVVHIKGDRLN